MIYRKITQIEIDMQTIDFMHVVEELNKDMHENCDMNACTQCAPIHSMIHNKNYKNN